jgi:hypothetical protein
MPVGKDSKQITAVITADEYEQLHAVVAARRNAGYKATVSKVIAEAVRDKLKAERWPHSNGQ